jgi:hypothetical protein
LAAKINIFFHFTKKSLINHTFKCHMRYCRVKNKHGPISIYM